MKNERRKFIKKAWAIPSVFLILSESNVAKGCGYFYDGCHNHNS